MNTGSITTDSRNPVAYVPKPTNNPNTATNRNINNGNDSIDTHMRDATAEEEKKCSNSGKTTNHTSDTKKVTWTE